MSKTELIVESKPFEPIWVMSKMASIEISQIGTVIGSVFEEIFKNHLTPSGPVMTFYHDVEFRPENANVEVCVPVAPAANAQNLPGVKLLNPGLCATCTFVGPYSQLGKAYAAVLKWIEENNFHISYAPFDVYESNPQDVKNPEELITQVWFPISK